MCAAQYPREHAGEFYHSLPCIDDDPNCEMARFVKMGRGIQEVLQSVENALVDAGYDDFVVATERGSFHWQTAEHARGEAAKD